MGLLGMHSEYRNIRSHSDKTDNTLNGTVFILELTWNEILYNIIANSTVKVWQGYKQLKMEL